jgi:hypothetical protein
MHLAIARPLAISQISEDLIELGEYDMANGHCIE